MRYKRVNNVESFYTFSELINKHFIIYQAIENLKDEMKFVNNIESYRITTDDILQVKIHDIGFQYDDSGKSCLDLFNQQKKH